ncbi:MAG: YIP1 family protein [Janthinobacterium lividum]
MSEVAITPQTVGLSQPARVADTVLAPSKTFIDVLRNANWWLPFVIVVLCGYLLAAAIQHKVGWSQLVDNEIRANPKLEQRLADMTPEQVAAQHKGMQYSFMGAYYAVPVTDLASLALMAVVLWPTINFGFGGSATYGRVLAVTIFAAIPGAIKGLLAAGLLFAGRSPESFTTDTMLGSNLGYYIEPAGPLKTLLTSVDLFSIWTAVLLSIGLAIVARTRRSNGYIAVFGWWILVTLIRTGFSAVGS